MKNIYIIKNNDVNHFQLKNSREAIEIAFLCNKEIEVFTKNGNYFTFEVDTEETEYQNRIKLENLIGTDNL